jgi:RNA polymerase sigma-70 factor (ECF subfamily)
MRSRPNPIAIAAGTAKNFEPFRCELKPRSEQGLRRLGTEKERSCRPESVAALSDCAHYIFALETRADRIMDNDQVNKLLARIGKQDQAAFEQLYKAFSRKVYAYLLNMLRDHVRAEEVLVDTMYQVWRNPAQFRGDSLFSTWLIGVARNKGLMVYRSRRPDEDHADLDDVAETLAADDDEGGYSQLAQKQRSEGVRQCMDKLSGEHRECLHLVFYEGYSLTEVAAVQRCPENTVKTRLFHARQKIKNCLRLLLEREGAGMHAQLRGEG